MTARMTWHKREHGAELRAIRSLTLEERGAYETILCLLYEDWAPLIDNERRIAGELGCSLRKWRSLRQSLIEKGKIRWTEDGRLTNDRFEEERVSAETQQKLYAEMGAKGGRKRAETRKNVNKNNENYKPALKPPLSEREEEEENNPPSPLGRGGRSRGLRLPDDWTPSEAVFEFAEQKLGLSRLQVSNISDGEFTDYWRAQPGARGRKVDWDATLRNWLRRNVESGKTAPAACRTAGGERAAKVRRYIETGTPEKPGFWVTSWGDPPDDPASEYHAEWKRQGGDRPKLRAISGGRT